MSKKKQKQAKRLLKKKFRAWEKEHVQPGVYISLAYFIKVLDCGENLTVAKMSMRRNGANTKPINLSLWEAY